MSVRTYSMSTMRLIMYFGRSRHLGTGAGGEEGVGGWIQMLRVGRVAATVRRGCQLGSCQNQECRVVESYDSLEWFRSAVSLCSQNGCYAKERIFQIGAYSGRISQMKSLSKSKSYSNAIECCNKKKLNSDNAVIGTVQLRIIPFKLLVLTITPENSTIFKFTKYTVISDVSTIIHRQPINTGQIKMALDYEASKTKLTSLLSLSPTAAADANTLIQMLRNQNPLNDLYSFLQSHSQPTQKPTAVTFLNECWQTIQNHRNKHKMQRQFVSVFSVQTVLTQLFNPQTARNVIMRLLPLTQKLKPTNSKRVDMLIGILNRLNFRQKYKLKQTDEEIAKFIDEKGVQLGVEAMLVEEFGREVCDKVVAEVTKELRNNVLPRSQKKVRTDPLANIVSKLDFYHNYGVELATDEIANEMHQHGIRKILKQLLLQQFGWKQIDRIEQQINQMLLHKDHKSQSATSLNVPH